MKENITVPLIKFNKGMFFSFIALFSLLFLNISSLYPTIAAQQVVQERDVVNVRYWRWDDPERTDLAENSYFKKRKDRIRVI